MDKAGIDGITCIDFWHLFYFYFPLIISEEKLQNNQNGPKPTS